MALLSLLTLNTVRVYADTKGNMQIREHRIV